MALPRLRFLVLSLTDWDAPQFGSRQQIALQLAKRGHRVFYVEVPRSLHSFVTAPEAIVPYLRRMGHKRAITESLLIYTPPPVIPFYYNQFSTWANNHILVRYLETTLENLRWSVDVFWTYWPNSASMIGFLGEQLTVYHCIDNFPQARYTFSSRATIRGMEDTLWRTVDLVLVRTPGLIKGRESLNQNTHLLPGGVDTDRFNPATVPKPPPYLTSISSPRIGFLGTIDDRLDFDLLLSVVRELPEMNFVFVGPLRRHLADVGRMRAQSNVHFVSPCTPDEAPSVMSAFDVGLIPYRINAYTEGVSPIKLYEYLAMEKPVVATPLPYVLRERDCVSIAEDSGSFVRLLKAAIANPGDPKLRRTRRERAKAHSWELHADTIERLLSTTLDKKRTG